MKIITLGNGFISSHLNYQNIDARICQVYPHSTLENIINLHKPDTIINCIGKTGRPNIDWCELNKQETYFANTILAAHLADICEKRSIHLIHIGSGCLYYSKSPYAFYDSEEEKFTEPGWKESDYANPLSYYSKSKYATDLLLGDMKNVSILRIRMPISDKNVSRNLINKLASYEKVIDVKNSVTFMSDFVRCIEWFVQNKNVGIYNICNPESISPAEIMDAYSKFVPNHKFTRISSEELAELTLAPRSNCILDTAKLNNAGFKMTSTKEALDMTLNNYFNL